MGWLGFLEGSEGFTKITFFFLDSLMSGVHFTIQATTKLMSPDDHLLLHGDEPRFLELTPFCLDGHHRALPL